jgi:hypothetical protein
MILFTDVDLKRIDRRGRDYPWPRPGRCKCGSTKLWGHGFVLMCFAGFARALEKRRYRCAVCGCVVRLRPKGYFPRVQTDCATVRHTLRHRIHTGSWPTGTATSRARHWLAALKRNALAILDVTWCKDLMAAFDRLVALGRVPVRRTI